jgi:hypothetical protein
MSIKRRCWGTRGSWCGKYDRQERLPSKPVPRGSRDCPSSCSGWGNCNHDTGLCECPAGEAEGGGRVADAVMMPSALPSLPTPRSNPAVRMHACVPLATRVVLCPAWCRARRAGLRPACQAALQQPLPAPPRMERHRACGMQQHIRTALTGRHTPVYAHSLAILTPCAPICMHTRAHMCVCVCAHAHAHTCVKARTCPGSACPCERE